MDRLTEIPLSKIKAAPGATPNDQRRVEDLAESVMYTGLVSPLIVREVSLDQYELIDGHHRAAALRMLAYETAPAIIKTLTNAAAVKARAATMFIRRDALSDFEVWESMFNLESSQVFKTQSELASALGRPRRHLTALHSFGRLPAAVLEILRTKPVLFNAKLAERLVASGWCDTHPDLVTAAIHALAASRIKNQSGVPGWIVRRAAKL